jgi:dCMP deaminase
MSANQINGKDQAGKAITGDATGGGCADSAAAHSDTCAQAAAVMGEAAKTSEAMARPSWDEYFMRIATQVATRTTCRRRAVGAVLVKDKRILATGYNGVPTGIEHCLTRGCLREQLGIPSGQQHELCRGLHAEQNAIIQAARYGINISGASCYCTTQPCIICAKMLINAGIAEIIYQQPYPDELTMQMLEEAGMTVRIYG